MPLPTPNLDDRRFQDLVDEAKRMIPRFTPEWTDHNVSDPGVTLIELFAWMVEILLFRVNRVPDKSLIRFMELMGVKLQPAAPARADLTFWLSAPPAAPLTIPAGTEVCTLQTQGEEAINFTTDSDLVVYPPGLLACFTSPNERVFDDQLWKLNAENEGFMAFSPRPRPGDAFYLGYEQNISQNILALEIACTLEGIGVDPANPPLAWEVWCGDEWEELAGDALERDGTGGLNTSGTVVLHLPAGMQAREISGRLAYWLRCLYVTPAPGQPAYSASPSISDLRSATLGGTVSATHSITIPNSILGRSDGSPGQVFRLEYPPVLPRLPGQHVEVQVEDGDWVAWAEREDFGDSRPADPHFVVDSVSGEVSFGPAIREPDGTERQHGAIPARGALVRFSAYCSGGGALGNVGKGTIRMLRHTVPYVDRVSNRAAATGGQDAETLEHAAFRAPQMLRTRFRAVTAEDYEYLAMEASSGVARACCLQPREAGAADGPPPGTVKLLLIPNLTPVDGRITPDQLRLPPRLIQAVRGYLDDRRQLTTLVAISEPDYFWVAVEVRLKVQPRVNPDLLVREATARLYRFLNPLSGGMDGAGWPFGRSLYPSEIYAILQGIAGVQYIQNVDLFLVKDGVRQAETAIMLPESGVIASAEHRISLVEDL
ncbi:MAG TPA: putative baseplate assembly protein [Herpetosiphonaceae bacterium]|nr:putative baseplate assembly protein [Herpetosiphonaceae bacterium]